MTDQDLYPRGPKDVPAELTRPTATYKHRAWLALARALKDGAAFSSRA